MPGSAQFGSRLLSVLSQRQLNVTAAIIFYTSAGRVQKFPCIVIEQ